MIDTTGATYTAEITGDATTPTGQPGTVITCTCATHKPGRRSAIVTKAMADGLRQHPDRIHGYVTLAWSPLAMAPQTSQRGPWRTEG